MKGLHDEVVSRVTLEEVEQRVHDHLTKGCGLAGEECVLQNLERLQVLHCGAWGSKVSPNIRNAHVQITVCMHAH